jgi:hypothetical protein
MPGKSRFLIEDRGVSPRVNWLYNKELFIKSTYRCGIILTSMCLYPFNVSLDKSGYIDPRRPLRRYLELITGPAPILGRRSVMSNAIGMRWSMRLDSSVPC